MKQSLGSEPSLPHQQVVVCRSSSMRVSPVPRDCQQICDAIISVTVGKVVGVINPPPRGGGRDRDLSYKWENFKARVSSTRTSISSAFLFTLVFLYQGIACKTIDKFESIKINTNIHKRGGKKMLAATRK